MFKESKLFHLYDLQCVLYDELLLGKQDLGTLERKTITYEIYKN